MGRFSVRIRRVMLLAAAFAVAAALSGVTAAHATTASGSGTPCSFGPATSCQSTDGAVALNIDYTNASACTFTWHVEWGDGSVSDVTVTDPADGYVLLAQHTYANANTYNISATGQGTTENCTTTPFTGYFTLLKADADPAFRADSHDVLSQLGGLLRDAQDGYGDPCYMASPLCELRRFQQIKHDVNVGRNRQ